MAAPEREYIETPSGTSFPAETDPKLIEVLEGLRESGKRVRIYYHSFGFSKTARGWGNDEAGTIGRSAGRQRVPLLIATKRSYGGNPISTTSVVRITESRAPHTVLYEKESPEARVSRLYGIVEHEEKSERDKENVLNFMSEF